jgi:HSP20 family protein
MPSLLGDVDRLFDALWQGTPRVPLREAVPVLAPRMDCIETASEIRLVVDLPGIEEEAIGVSFEDGVVTITAERKAEQVEEDAQKTWHHVERHHGCFERKLRLPVEVDAEAIRATHKNGVLTVVLPKLQVPAPRSIPVTAS